MMTIQTDITQKDWIAFTKCVGRNATKNSAPYVALLPVGIGIAAALATTRLGIEHHAPSFAAGVVFGVVLLISLSKAMAKQMRPAEDGYILGPQQVEVTDAGFRVMSQRHEAVFQWDGVRGMEVTAKHIFVMVDRNAGIIVPRRSFASDAEREQFVSEVQGRARGLPA
jgi:hypothetical protein